MVMKDKLIKNHHHRLYYQCRRLGVAVLAFVSVGTIIAVPAYITFNEAGNQEHLAEEQVKVEEELLHFSEQ